MSLSMCRSVFGYTNLILENPLIATYQDALYIPDGVENAPAGAYDRTRKILPGGGHVVGVPTLHYGVGAPFTNLDPEDHDFAEDQDYFFIGHLHTGHYGHFLVGGLARFWFLQQKQGRTPRFLYLDRKSPEDLFSPPFARLLFEALGLQPSDFVHFYTPKRIRSVTVVSTSFEENNCVHVAYAHMCNHLGRLLTRDTAQQYVDRPIYLSKHRLRQGVSTVVNEEVFCQELERQGVEIFCPETLDLVDQINLFQFRPVVTGFIGSAFHTSAFVPQSKLLILNHGETVWSNQILQDKANSNKSLYLYPTAGLANQGRNASFGNNFILENPHRVAADFRRAIEAYMNASRQNQSGTQPSNIALRKPTRQSSIHAFANHNQLPDSGHGAVSGFLTGGFQFHTSNEDQPWWQVDLLGPHRINEIRIYNRLDDASWRASHIVCFVSSDGQSWTELFRREDDEPFGGIDGHPFVWRGGHPSTVGFVRLQILRHEDFHLDQVEIIGIAEPHSFAKQTPVADAPRITEPKRQVGWLRWRDSVSRP